MVTAGASLVAYATQRSPWVWSDSIEYLEAARNFAAGKGLVLVRATGRVVPMYLRPPFYSVLLGALLAAGLDPIEAGRWIDVSLFFSILIMLVLFTQALRESAALALALPAYFITSHIVILNFTGLMSEPLFLALAFSNLGLAAAYLQSGRRSLLIGSASLAGMAWLTRFAGIACVFVTTLVALAHHRDNLARRLRDSFAMVCVGTLPFALWALFVRSGGYFPGVYNLPSGALWEALQPVRGAYVGLLWEWLPLRLLIPISSYRGRAVVLLVFSVFAILAGLLLILRANRQAPSENGSTFLPTLPVLLLAFSAVHAFVVAATYLFVVLPQPALDDRVLLPSQVTLLTGLVLYLCHLVRHVGSRAVRLVVPLALILPLVWTEWPETWEYVQRLRAEGFGYTSKSWQQSHLVDVIRDLPPSLAIVSNDIDAVTFFAQRGAFRIPELEDSRPNSLWGPFGQDPLSEPERLFAEGHAALVMFSLGRYQFSQIYGDQAPERLDALTHGLYILYEDWDGGVYLSAPP